MRFPLFKAHPNMFKITQDGVINRHHGIYGWGGSTGDFLGGIHFFITTEFLGVSSTSSHVMSQKHAKTPNITQKNVQICPMY